jgi:hypothetical protein
MTVAQKAIQVLGGIDSDTPDFSVDPRYCRDIVNFEAIPTGGGVQTVKGYQRFDGQPTATSASFYAMYFKNASVELTENDVIYQGSDKAVVLDTAVLTGGDYGSGTAEGYVHVIYLQAVFADDTDYTDGSSIIGTTDHSEQFGVPSGSVQEYYDLLKRHSAFMPKS